MNDIGKIKIFLNLQIEHFSIGVMVYQLAYTKKILKQFYMDKSHPLSSPMFVCSLDVKNDPFHPYENGEELKYPILVLLMHLCILLTVLG